jgi:hypothetical protein
VTLLEAAYGWPDLDAIRSLRKGPVNQPGN